MPDPRKMQVNLLGFMDKYGAAHFTETLWNLLISAQNTVGGVPAEVSLPTPFEVVLTFQFIEAKKKEIQMQQALGQQPVPEHSNLPPRPQGRDRPKVCSHYPSDAQD
jgi:serine/arginine repetitive matrix protein 1